MRYFPIYMIISLAVAATLTGQVCRAQLKEDASVRNSSQVLEDIMGLQFKSIPNSLLADAQAIAIVPNVVKGSFVVGVRHGKGVVVVRDPAGGWRPPQFVSLTGGSVGFQIGVQSTDVILVFKTKKSVEGLLSGKFTIGADAAAAAGPVGRNAAAATDAHLKAEIYSYSRSRGLFAGVSLDGSVLEIDGAANRNFYRDTGISPDGDAIVENPRIPESAAILLTQIATYSSPQQAEGGVVIEQPQPMVDLSNDPAIALRGQLAQSSRQLQGLLDEGWQRYLALPTEIYNGRAHPRPDILAKTLTNYDLVAANPQYRALNSRAEFKNTHQLLRQYLSSLNPHRPTELQLPPPPQR